MALLQASISFQREMTDPIRHLLDLVGSESNRVLAAHWSSGTFDALTLAKDPCSRRLPAQPAVALHRLGIDASFPASMYIPSRVKRLVRHRVGSTLKSLVQQDRVLRSLTTEMTPTPYVSGAYGKTIRRMRDTYLARHPATPEDELRIPLMMPAPTLRPLLNLGAVDKQLAILNHTEDRLTLRLKAPTSATPDTRADWPWHTLEFAIPSHLRTRALMAWHLPTIRASGADRMVVTFAYTEAVPDVCPRAGINRMLGVDWSPSVFAVSAMVEREATDGCLVSNYRARVFDDRGLGVKLRRLQEGSEQLHAKIARITALLNGSAPSPHEDLAKKKRILQIEAALINRKRRMLNRELAFLFARHMVDVALQTDATAIALEDLRSLQAGGIGRLNNNMTSQSARRKGAESLTHVAARYGLQVIVVDPKGTSASCPCCQALIERPDGYHSAYCPACGLTGQRDGVAAVNIAARGLTQIGTAKKRKTNTLLATTQAQAHVKLDRTKKTATPKRPRHKRVRRSVNASPKRPYRYPVPHASARDMVYRAYVRSHEEALPYIYLAPIVVQDNARFG